MDRREFLGLAVKVAGAVVVLHQVPNFGPKPAPYPDYFARRAMRGDLNAADCKAYIVTDRGTYACDGLGVARLELQSRSTGIIHFEKFEAAERVLFSKVLLVDEKNYVLSEKTCGQLLNHGDVFKLSWTLRFA